jgi:hypothetical protein
MESYEIVCDENSCRAVPKKAFDCRCISPIPSVPQRSAPDYEGGDEATGWHPNDWQFRVL